MSLLMKLLEVQFSSSAFGIKQKKISVNKSAAFFTLLGWVEFCKPFFAGRGYGPEESLPKRYSPPVLVNWEKTLLNLTEKLPHHLSPNLFPVQKSLPCQNCGSCTNMAWGWLLRYLWWQAPAPESLLLYRPIHIPQSSPWTSLFQFPSLSVLATWPPAATCICGYGIAGQFMSWSVCVALSSPYSYDTTCQHLYFRAANPTGVNGIPRVCY